MRLEKEDDDTDTTLRKANPFLYWLFLALIQQNYKNIITT